MGTSWSITGVKHQHKAEFGLCFSGCLMGVWRVLENSLEGVWYVSGGFLKGVWRVEGIWVGIYGIHLLAPEASPHKTPLVLPALYAFLLA